MDASKEDGVNFIFVPPNSFLASNDEVCVRKFSNWESYVRSSISDLDVMVIIPYCPKGDETPTPT